ncbi:hypothetical protein M2390_000086 [Mycetocola sp. BIGb0189]|uniref:PqqD family peptide modification chaperone n=1 Tax=Mycetocola sp. BIGb0189 TaxID=2940604 RepID=UPI002168DF94|nr:PqqD family peptide modification chaperone [Mycetocola sp. BIGb0189]MCS4274928.1 hypothetical protein [Mycetocola sp. BIGb0189]
MVLDSTSGEYFQLNAGATAVLHMLLDGETPAHAAAVLANEHANVTLEQVKSDINAIQLEFAARGWISQP